MAQQKHLDNPPILEAIIDFRVITKPSFDFSSIKQLEVEFQDEYLALEPLRQFEASLRVKQGQPVHQSFELKDIHTYRMPSKDGKQIALFKKDGFTFSRLAKYTSWNDVFHIASRLWLRYANVVPIEEIQRLAVRYVNRILLPFPLLGGLEEFLEVYPNLPLEKNQMLETFLSRYMISDVSRDASAIITQALEPVGEDIKTPLIFDIDVFKEASFGHNAKAVLAHFENLREIKNSIFFDSLKEKALELFS